MTASPLTAATLAERVRARFLSESGDLSSLMVTEIASSQAPGEEHDALALQVRNHLEGFGVLQPFLDDLEIEEVWINGPHSVFVATAGVGRRVEVELEAPEMRRLIERMLRHTGRRVDMSQPFVDASLPDGSRLHVVIPDITREHWSINIRKFQAGLRELSDLVQAGALTLQAAHTPDGRHAEVRLSSMWAPPVVSDFFPASLRISATARSQVFIH